MERFKYFLLIFVVVGQILGFIFLFLLPSIAITFYVLYGLAVVVIFILLIKERLKEKKEDDEHDHSDY